MGWVYHYLNNNYTLYATIIVSETLESIPANTEYETGDNMHGMQVLQKAYTQTQQVYCSYNHETLTDLNSARYKDNGDDCRIHTHIPRYVRLK